MLKKYFDEQRYEEIKESDNLFFKALEIVTVLFDNDTDKGGYPYLNHLMKVYKSVTSEEEKVIALLHDVIEDKDVTKKDLIEIGFPEKVANDVECLTRSKKDEYQDYIDKVVKSGSLEALHVKMADLKHNMDLSRIKNPTEADFDRVENRYKRAYTKITNKLDEMEK